MIPADCKGAWEVWPPECLGGNLKHQVLINRVWHVPRKVNMPLVLPLTYPGFLYPLERRNISALVFEFSVIKTLSQQIGFVKGHFFFSYQCWLL